MEVSYFSLLDLEAALESRITFRKSLLMDATSLRVGIFLSNLFLASFANGASL